MEDLDHGAFRLFADRACHENILVSVQQRADPVFTQPLDVVDRNHDSAIASNDVLKADDQRCSQNIPLVDFLRPLIL